LPLVKPELAAHGLESDDAYLGKVCVLLREKVNFAKEIISQGKYFFTEEYKFNEEVVRKKWNGNTNNYLTALAGVFESEENFDANNIENAFKNWCESNGVKTGELMQPLRVAVSGEPAGPPVFEMISLLGKESVLRRIQRATQSIQAQSV